MSAQLAEPEGSGSGIGRKRIDAFDAVQACDVLTNSADQLNRLGGSNVTVGQNPVEDSGALRDGLHCEQEGVYGR